MAAQHPTLQFLPWVRQGMAADIRNPDTLSADQNAVVTLPVDLWINRASGIPDVSVKMQLYGPGDVTGIDPTAGGTYGTAADDHRFRTQPVSGHRI